MTEVSSASISYTISFLRTVAKLMLPSDLDIFEEVCERLNYGNATLDDIKKLRGIETKFLSTGDDD
jgi:hypothetical protein